MQTENDVKLGKHELAVEDDVEAENMQKTDIMGWYSNSNKYEQFLYGMQNNVETKR